MKRILSLLLAVLLLCGCVQVPPEETTEPVQTTGQAVETTVPAETTERDDSLTALDGGLFGIDCVYLRRDGVRADDNKKDVFYHTGTFLYYGDGKSWDTAGEATELLTLEYKLFKTGDFDGDGSVELFTAGQYNVYRLFDREKGQLQETRLAVVPDNILDYGLLLDSGLYLYQEKWVRFLAEPEEYIRQMAARGKENFYSMRPTGVLPKVITDSQFREAYTAMHRMLDGTQTEDTRWMIYRMLLELECSCDAETAVNLSQTLNSAFPYERLLEKWSLTVEGMGEETNCFEQFLYLLQREPLALLRAMAAAPWQEYSRGYDGIVRWTATEAYHFNKEAFAGMVEYMETGAATEEEKTLARMFRDLYTQLDAPWDVDTLVNGDGEVLWKALLEDTEGVIRLMGSLSADQVRKAANSLFGMKMPSEQNQAKCYQALLAMPFENLKETEEFFACRLMLELELWGGQRQQYTPGKAFDFYKLFTKSKYSDGASSEMCSIQFEDVFTQVPEEFLKELAAWGEDPTRVISQLKYAYGYQEDGQEQLRQVLSGVLEKTKNEAVKALIESILEN